MCWQNEGGQVRPAAGRRRSAGWLIAVAWSWGCLATGPDASSAPPLCSNRADEATAVAALVRVNGNVGRFPNICSGVAITRTLVITHVYCAVRAVEIDAGTPLQDAGPVVCDSHTGSPLEDGRFLAWTPPVLGQGVIQVIWRRSDGSGVVAGVERVFTSGAASYCSGELAVLKLGTELDVEKLPLRLEDSSWLDEPVAIRGFSPESNLSRGRALPSMVESMTFEAGDDTIPPRSLLLSHQVCSDDLGGGIFSPETGALVGIVTNAFGPGCGDPEGKTIALRLAPFRRLLNEAAEDARVSLVAELGTKTPSGSLIPPCAP